MLFQTPPLTDHEREVIDRINGRRLQGAYEGEDIAMLLKRLLNEEVGLNQFTPEGLKWFKTMIDMGLTFVFEDDIAEAADHLSQTKEFHK
ncbi:hypothetical protein GWN42_22810, partial [candidate division KSB1 bacterium]|nr:hypothetical protein [candidate division KSB1 bacterium]